MNSRSELRIATRQSPLALWQAEHVKSRLEALLPDCRISLLGITTSGDRFLAKPLAYYGGKGLFVKELESALLKGEADLAVHSMKDVPTELPEGLVINAILKRDDPRDALVSNDYADLNELPHGATVGTSSLRRRAQLLSLRPDLRVVSFRGNVNTRLKKLDAGEVSATVLAAAGLERLGFSDRITSVFDPDKFIPAIAQGALGIEQRADDDWLSEVLARVTDHRTQVEVMAERAFNETLQGGCHAPIAAHAVLTGAGSSKSLQVTGLVAAIDGSRSIRHSAEGPIESATALGAALGASALESGAAELMAASEDEPR